MARLNRRLLIANAQIAPTSSYVTDGLILHLDGIDYGGQSGKWIDLVDGTVFTLNGTVAKGDDCWIFTNGYFQSSQSYRYTMQTIEIVYKKTTSNNTGIFNGAFTAMTIAYLSSKLQFGGGSYAKTISNTPINQIVTASSNYLQASGDSRYTDFFINGEQITDIGNPVTSYGGTTSGTIIGKYVYTSIPAFVGNIYSVRIYNRTLTAEEVAQNFAVDKERFNIPD